MPGHDPPWTFHASTARAVVRGRAHRHHAVRCMDEQGACILVAPHGRPRLWGRIVGAVLDGFDAGFRAASGASGGRRLIEALEDARRALDEISAQLIERSAPDAAALALWMEGETVHGAVVGAGRAYVHHHGHTERLSPRELPPDGLRNGAPHMFTGPLHPGTLVFAGTEPAFTAEAVHRSAETLQRDPDLQPSTLVGLLTDPAEQEGLGAAAVALRV
jgi:hypothetical protein